MSDATNAGTATNDAGATQTADQGQAPGSAGSTALTAEPSKDAAQATTADDKAGSTDKPADGEKEGDKPADKPADDKPVEYKFELPDDVQVDEARLGEFTEIAKDLKLPPDAAQKIVNLAVAQQKAAVEAHQAQVKEWGEQVAADKELGKPENQAVARQAVEQFGTPELKDLLNRTGMGNHPEVVKAFLKVGKAISEDKVIVGRGDAPAVKDAASVLYPNQAKA